MPREAARIWLLCTDRREERLQDITIADCLREGIINDYCEKICGHESCFKCYPTCIMIKKCDKAQGIKPQFIKLWDSINKKPGTTWEDNPVVIPLSFRLFFEGRVET